MTQLTNCAHCCKTGSCTSGGQGGRSCAACIAFWKGRLGKSFESTTSLAGIKCSVCLGKGLVEPSGEVKWDYRYPAFLAGGLSLLAFALLGLTYAKGGDSFDKSIIFVGTLLGSITGFYFGGAKPVSDNSTVLTPTGGTGTATPETGTNTNGATDADTTVTDAAKADTSGTDTIGTDAAKADTSGTDTTGTNAATSGTTGNG